MSNRSFFLKKLLTAGIKRAKLLELPSLRENLARITPQPSLSPLKSSRNPSIMKRTPASLPARIALLFTLFLTLAFSLHAIPVKKRSDKSDLPPEIADYKLPALDQPGSYSIAILPDIQSYIRFDRNHGIFDLMNTWIVENIPTLNIQFALCTGDIVQDNELLHNHSIETTFGVRRNLTSAEQWAAAARAFERLDNKLPYILCTGNHDYGYTPGSSQNRNTEFPKYFPVTKNPLTIPHIAAVAKNAHGVATLENAAYEFIPPGAKRKFLILSLEFAPRDEILEWAKKLCESSYYQNHTVILLTHSYMRGLSRKSIRIDKTNYALTDANSGEEIWQKLVKPSKNIAIVISGHIAAPNKIEGHIGFRIDTNDHGKRVNQMVFNAQALGGGWRGNGGDGWLRWLEFYPDNKTVKVKTFSPLFAISPSTRDLAWLKDENNEFTFEMD